MRPSLSSHLARWCADAAFLASGPRLIQPSWNPVMNVRYQLRRLSVQPLSRSSRLRSSSRAFTRRVTHSETASSRDTNAVYERSKIPLDRGSGDIPERRPTRPSGVARAGSSRRKRGRATYTRAIRLLDEIKRLLTGAKADADAVAEGEVPAATQQGEDERETSTNAQMAGASDEPWPGND
jgi:hypothetical protein